MCVCSPGFSDLISCFYSGQKRISIYAQAFVCARKRVRRAYTCNELRRKARDHRAGRPVSRMGERRGAIGIISDRCFSCSPLSEYGR